MKIKFTILIFSCLISMQTSPLENNKIILEKLSKERYFPYQDIIINNEVIFKGVGPDCAFRYDAIKKALSEYKRPIKILDIGASNGYFSFKIANDFEAVCVMVDVSDRLHDICELNTDISNIIYLKRALSLADLQKLAKHEHFDVVLALNVIHHMSPWQEIIDVIFELGDTIIIETPPSNDSRTQNEPSIPFIEQYLLNKEGGEIIAKTARADANNFNTLDSLVLSENILDKKIYIPNAYAKMFCFKNKPSSNHMLSFNQEMFEELNGVLSKTIN